MNFSFLKRRKFYWKMLLFVALIPIAVFTAVLGVMYLKQDAIIQDQIETMNSLHKGQIVIDDTDLAPFQNFPFVSIKLKNTKIFETKDQSIEPILDVEEISIGFDIRDIIKGIYDIRVLRLEEGFLNIILHEDGTNNLLNALETPEGVEDTEPFNIHIKKIRLKNLDIHKLNESNNMDVETYIYEAKGGFKTKNNVIAGDIDSKLLLNIMNDGNPTYVHHKHFDIHTDISFDELSGMLEFKPSRITMEHGDFNIEGSLDTKNDMDIDLKIYGTKPNFDMLIAFAPEDLIPTLEKYGNKGNIYFNAVIQGPSAQQMPFIDAEFGASEAFLENLGKKKRIEDMGFKGHFTNGEKRSLETMEFSLTDMQATLEKGDFTGDVVVTNFEAPEINMQMDADFNLEFLADFFNLTDFEGTSGSVKLKMNFHDIIDLDHPEKTLSDLNKSYFSELRVKDLKFDSPDLPAPLENLDMHVIMKGKKADLDQFEFKMGNTDLSLNGFVSDLPAIIHHTDIPVTAHLEITSKVFDVAQLTKYSEKDSTGFDERIEDLSVGFSFKSTARAFTESEHLPIGEFFVDSLHAQLKHYPHELHDFHVDVLVEDRDLKIKDFTGYLDDSDFHFNGLIHDYAYWFQEELNGDVDLDITLHSDLLRLEDIFTYKGDNFVPEDYRHEEFEKLDLHVNSSMHYIDSGLHSIDIDLDRLDAKMHVHPMRFDDFHGRFHYEDDHLVIERFHGKMGHTVFDMDLNYYLGEDETIRKRDNHLRLNASYIDFDELFNFSLDAPTSASTTTTTVKTTEDVAEHAEAFNLYELPFTDMGFDINIKHFIYHRIDLQNIETKLHTTADHYIYVDTMNMDAAGGSFRMSGYFNGSDPEHIYMKPNLIVEGANIDKLLFKFENFGQDVVVSDNVHGIVSAKINGNIRVYPDLVPDLDQSEVHMDVEITDGRLINYKPMLMLADYMGNKDLTNIRFDTLANHLDFNHGILKVPKMTLESTLGHFEISGEQDMDFNMEYYVRIPWKLVNEVSKNKLFGGKKKEEIEDEIVELDQDRRVRYLNMKIKGTADDYKISIGKESRERG